MRRGLRRTHSLHLITAAIAVAVGCGGTGQPSGGQSPSTAAAPQSVTAPAQPQGAQAGGGEELLVQLRPQASVGVMAATMSQARALPTETVVKASQQPAGRGEIILVRVAPGVSLEQARAQLQASGQVAFVEPNYHYSHQQTSNDTYYADGRLWGMYGDDKPTPIGPIGVNPPGSLTTNAFGIQAEKAWNAGHTGSANGVIAVMDEGIDINHPDLKDNIWTNPGETGTDSTGADKRTNKKDDDGNGKIDDVYGWDFRNNDNTVFDGTPSTPNIDKHGTHVAGTIGAKGGNAAGVAGVVWNVRIISAKFLGPNDGTTADAIKAIDYLIDLKQRHRLNLIAINNSWGGGGKSVLLHDAFKRAARAGILSICAAGNGGVDGVGDDDDSAPFYPASYDTTADWRAQGGTAGESYDAIIAVASLVKNGTLARYSNFGKTTVDLGAPGDAIYSTLPHNNYGELSGTSMATPHVTGGVALYLSTHPGATARTIKAAILASATGTPTAAVKGKSVTGGRLNVAKF